jgi:hypothetical protein
MGFTKILSIATKYKKGLRGKSNVHKKEGAKMEMCTKRRDELLNYFMCINKLIGKNKSNEILINLV